MYTSVASQGLLRVSVDNVCYYCGCGSRLWRLFLVASNSTGIQFPMAGKVWHQKLEAAGHMLLKPGSKKVGNVWGWAGVSRPISSSKAAPPKDYTTFQKQPPARTRYSDIEACRGHFPFKPWHRKSSGRWWMVPYKQPRWPPPCCLSLFTVTVF